MSAQSSVARRRRLTLTRRHEEAVIKEIVELVDHRDQPTRVRSKRSDDWPTAILKEADAADASLIVLSNAADRGSPLRRDRESSLGDEFAIANVRRKLSGGGETTPPHPQGLRP
jgi:hypothetical protein